MSAGDGASFDAGAVEFRLLGELEVVLSGRRVDAGTARQRAVLAALLFNANRVVSPDELVARVWGTGRRPDRPVNTVQTYLSLLRRALGNVAITRRSGGYVLAVDPAQIDLHRFRRLTAQAQRSRDDERTVALLQQALGLWRGDAVAELDSPWFDAIRATLGNERLAAELDLVDAQLRLGRHADVLASLLDRADRNPLDERIAGQAILALYRSGRQADALARYQLIRQLLADELGNDPGLALRQLHQRILTSDPTLVPPVAPSPTTRPKGPIPEQLPAPPTLFTGRVQELGVLDAVLATDADSPDTVAITAISGTAGVGKTALALRWAHHHRDRFPDGQLFVNLRGYDPGHPVDVGDALAQLLVALDVPPQDIPVGPDERAARYRTAIARRRMLVLLDNAATTEQITPLLPGTPSCTVMVTSRDSLGGTVALHGARRIVLDVLPLADAVNLLGKLIGARVDAEPAAAVAFAKRCAQLPLALRVAAERAALHPTAPLAAAADELAEQRLSVLDPGDDPRAVVRAVFFWSYRHLSSDTSAVFRLLGLHPGPTLDTYAVSALTDLPLAQADRVVDSLTRAHLVVRSDTGRLAMHDLLHAYANELVTTEDLAATRQIALTRLFDYYVSAAAGAMDSLHAAERHTRPVVPPSATPVPALADPAAARAWLDAERLTLIEVCAYAAEHGWPQHAVSLSVILYRYLESGHYTDALTLHSHALHAARGSGDRHAEATALTNLGAVYRLLGSYGTAGEHLGLAADLFAESGDLRGQARALSNLGVVDDRTGRHDSAAGYCRRALALYRQAGDRHGEAATLTNLGAIESETGRQTDAAEYLRQAIALYRALGDRWGEAAALSNLGDLVSQLGDQQTAAAHLGAALIGFRDLGHRYGQATVLSTLGDVYTRLGDYDAAVEHHLRALTLYSELGHRYGEANVLNGLGEARAAAGDLADAVAQHTAALAVATEIGDLDERVRAESGLALIGRRTEGAQGTS
jgi:DNA-binding SARP family transcriptional activator/tetratricopeptide (TPR) repeat protein